MKGNLAQMTFRSPVSTEEMRSIEERGQLELGVSKLIMMENAGSVIANHVFQLREKLAEKGPNSNRTRRSNGRRRAPVEVLAIAGTGNNGGDVFVAARHLAYWSKLFRITVALIGNANDIHAEEASTNWRILQHIPEIRKIEINGPEEIHLLEEEISHTKCLVVGIFGTGFKGRPRELQQLAIDTINRAKGPLTISVDIPSGMEADTGASDYAVISDVTITMHAIKKGMLSNSEARRKTGNVLEANIGLPI